jgi:hypothetical protein
MLPQAGGPSAQNPLVNHRWQGHSPRGSDGWLSAYELQAVSMYMRMFAVMIV